MTSFVRTMAVNEAHGPLMPTTTPAQTPPEKWVRVAVVASGVCNADISTASAAGSSVAFPVIPGHEVAGVVAEVGEGVQGWEAGDRVTVGWFGGSCGHCRYCQHGDVVHCKERKIPGLSYPGGWAQSITVPADALSRVPEGLDFFDAAPFGCAGVTTFNAVRKARTRPGGRVAVFGLGGLGHLAIQFATKLGYETIAIARGDDREQLAYALGAETYLNSDVTSPGAALAAMGGADLIIYTASSTEPVTELVKGLAVHGQITLIGVDAGAVSIPSSQLVMNAQTVTGHLTGSARETQEAMEFAVLNGIRPVIERMELERATEAVERLRNGEARFRIVLETGVAP